jgi:hypothetical protein
LTEALPADRSTDPGRPRLPVITGSSLASAARAARRLISGAIFTLLPLLSIAWIAAPETTRSLPLPVLPATTTSLSSRLALTSLLPLLFSTPLLALLALTSLLPLLFATSLLPLPVLRLSLTLLTLLPALLLTRLRLTLALPLAPFRST